ncbi:MAG: hypothetical protein ABFD69_01340 [Candidatus Sumerlaeia bacterium]
MDSGHEGDNQLQPIQPPGGPGDCAICHRPIADDYFMLNSEPWCASCHAKEGTIKPKLTFGTFMRGVVFGVGAAILGGGLWALTAIITGYELGLVAIVVGLIVGYGIRLGGRNMGGRAFQFLALIMTFYTLAYANIPIIIHVMMKDPEISQQVSGWFKEENKKIEQVRARAKVAAENESDTTTLEAVAAAARSDQSSSATLAMADEDESTSAAVEAAAAGAASGEDEATAPRKRMGFAKALVILILLLVALVTIGPPAIYVMLIIGSPMSAVFLAIALWEAWRINRREDRVFAGPFRKEAIEFDRVDSVAP